MAEPFKRKDEGKGGVSSTFRRRSSVTLERIEDLLAAAACVQDVGHAAIRGVCEERGIDLKRVLARGRAALYGRYLRYCLDDNVLSDQENEDLNHLRDVLMLSPAEVLATHDDVAIEVYGEAVHDVLTDYHLDEEEAQFLRRLREDLHLPDDRANEIFRTESVAARSRAVSEASSKDPVFIQHRVSAGEFTGRSDDSLEAAINDAISRASLVVPRLYWFEVTETAGYVEEGSASRWHVSIRAGIRPEELT